MTAVIGGIAIASIPLGILAMLLYEPKLRRCAAFWSRLGPMLLVIVAPEIAGVVVHVHDPAAETLLFSALLWGLLMLAPARFLLFESVRPGSEPGSNDGDDPPPDTDGPSPDRPHGGLVLPLADAEPAAGRLRDHTSDARRPARAPLRRPSRPPARVGDR